MRALALLVIPTVVLACGSPEGGEGPAPTGPVDLTVSLAPPEHGYQVVSKPWVIEPHSERQMCDVVRIDPVGDEGLVWFDRFESRSADGTHHMNVLAGEFSAGDFGYPGLSEAMLGFEIGQYDCEELGDLMESQGIQVFYPSQRTHQVGGFPAGVGYPAVVPLVLIMNHHYINTGEKTLRVNTALNLHRAPEGSVSEVAGFVWGSDDRIEIPAQGRSLEGGTCVLGQDVNLIAISSHSHERARCFTMHTYDGAGGAFGAEAFFVNKDWESPPIVFFDQVDWTGEQVLPMKAGDGISFACHYANLEDRLVTNGPSANDEMCIFVALGYPANLTVAEVEAVVASGGVDAFQRFSEGTRLPCTFSETPTPWPGLGAPLPPEAPDACADLLQTE